MSLFEDMKIVGFVVVNKKKVTEERKWKIVC